MICKICKKEKILAKFLGICKDCILEKWEEAKNFIEIAHRKSRKEFPLPEEVPKSKSGIKCNLCANECQIGEGEFGFCGLRKNENGKLISFVSREKQFWNITMIQFQQIALLPLGVRQKKEILTWQFLWELAILIVYFVKIGTLNF